MKIKLALAFEEDLLGLIMVITIREDIFHNLSRGIVKDQFDITLGQYSLACVVMCFKPKP